MLLMLDVVGFRCVSTSTISNIHPLRKPMGQETLFKQLERELRQFLPILAKATDSILDQEVSKYPIFIVHKGEMNVGIVLIDKEKNGGSWSINASILEEFAAKQLIQSEKIENFQEIYKDPEQHFCLFVLSQAGANFIFLPRPKSE